MKLILFNFCLDFINTRIANIQTAIADARSAQQDDTKSSAGDKYETSREMMTQEIENNMTHLLEAEKAKQVLLSIDPHQTADVVWKGSLVFTDSGNFFIAVSAGKVVVEEIRYTCISTSSPIGKAMLGKKAGDAFVFLDKAYKLLEVI